MQTTQSKISDGITIETLDTEALLNLNICNALVGHLDALKQEDLQGLDVDKIKTNLNVARNVMIETLSTLEHHALDIQSDKIKDRKEALRKGLEEKRFFQVYQNKL